jgi:hypothetical protein
MKLLWIFLGAILLTAETRPAEPPLRSEALTALERGVEYFRTQVASQGTYLWQYSEDLSQREGENKATTMQGWVQPPGTPAVGLVLLHAWHATSNANFLEAARETAHGLIRGQLQSGGWTYSIDFSPEGRKKLAYRFDGKPTARNFTTFDDDTTQAALRFLMRTDMALRFSDAKIHEAVEYALTSLLKAQYPNGAWPQGYDRFPEPANFPVKKASFPDSWSRVYPGSAQYWLRYTLNDNSHATLVQTILEAGSIYEAPAAGDRLNRAATRCRAAAQKAGDFLLLAQMPLPQPAWAQQYSFDMHPAWARKFEPPAISGGESQGALRTLLVLYQATGRADYLSAMSPALDYLRRSRLPDGRLARFYELRSNRPLYFTKAYELTHEDTDLPTHYAFKIGDDTETLRREYERLKNLPPDQLQFAGNSRRAELTPALVAQVKSVIETQDGRGRWVEEGRLKSHPPGVAARIIRCATFNRNVEVLSRYLEATRASNTAVGSASRQ